MERPEVDYTIAEENAKYIKDDIEMTIQALAAFGHGHRRQIRSWDMFDDIDRDRRLMEAQEQSRKFKEKITKKRGKR